MTAEVSRLRRVGSTQPLKPSVEERKQVEAFAAYGIPQEQMCLVLGITLKTLHKHFRVELDTGMVKANARVAQSLYEQAVGAPAEYDSKGRVLRSEQPRNTAAGIFWAKSRMGWKEREVHEHSGLDGGPIEFADARSKLADRVARLAAGGSARKGDREPEPA